jgi:hypothetical protein
MTLNHEIPTFPNSGTGRRKDVREIIDLIKALKAGIKHNHRSVMPGNDRASHYQDVYDLKS